MVRCSCSLLNSCETVGYARNWYAGISVSLILVELTEPSRYRIHDEKKGNTLLKLRQGAEIVCPIITRP